MSKLNKMFSIRTFFDEQKLEQMAQERYDEDRQYPENFSNWYPKIEDVGNFKIAKVINNQVFTYENVKDMQATDMYDNVDWKRMNDILKPTLDILKPGYTYSIKNGCYSNKFDFNTLFGKYKLLKEDVEEDFKRKEALRDRYHHA